MNRLDVPVKIVGLGGSLVRPSVSLAALKVALAAASDAGAATELFDVRELDLPFFPPRTEEIPEAALLLADAVYGADGMIWSSPMYHGTISGSFKNALDWLELLADRDPPYLTGKAIGLISAAGGNQALQAINTMEFVVRALRGWTVPLVAPVGHSWQAFDAHGQPRDESLESQLRLVGQEVVRGAESFSRIGPPIRIAARKAS